MSSSSSSSKAEMGGGGDNNNSNVNNDKNNKKRAVTSTSTSTSALSPRGSSTATTTSYSNKKQKMMNTSATTISTTTRTTTPTTISNEQPIFCWVTQGKTDHYATIVDPLVLAVLAKERKKADGTSRNNVTRSGTKRTCRAAAGNNTSNSKGGRTDLLSRLLSLSMTEMEIKWCSTKQKQKVLVSSVKLDEDPVNDNTASTVVFGSPEGRGIGGRSKRPRRSSTSAAAMQVAASNTTSVLRGGRARGRERHSPVQLLSILKSNDSDEDGTTIGFTPSSVRRERGRPRKQPPSPPQQQETQTQPALSSINNNGSSNGSGRNGDGMGSGIGVVMGGSNGEPGRGESCGPGEFIEGRTTVSTGTMESTSSNNDDEEDGGGSGKDTATRISTTPPPSSSSLVGVIRPSREQPGIQSTTHNNNGSTSTGLEGRGGDAMGGTGIGIIMEGGSSGELGGPELRGKSRGPGGFVAKDRTTTTSTGTMKYNSTSSHGSSTRSGNRDDDDHERDDDVSEDEYNDDKVRSKENNEDTLRCEDEADADDDDRTVAMSPVRDDSNVTAAGHNTTVTGEGNNNNNVDDKNTEGKNDNADDDDDGAAASKEFESTFKSLTTLLSTSILTATATARGEEEEDGEAVRVRDAAAFEFHYYVFQVLFMIGFLLHCRKYNDWTEPVTLLHILLFVMTSSSASQDATSNVIVPSSGNGKKQTRVFFSFSVLLRELLFLTFLGLVITTAVDRSPQTANDHMVMGFISFFCLVPLQVTRVLTQLHVFTLLS